MNRLSRERWSFRIAGLLVLLRIAESTQPLEVHAALRGKKALIASSSGKQNVNRTRFGIRHGIPEQIETWSDHGAAVQSTLSDAQLTDLAAGITAQTYLAELHAIVDPERSRFIADKGNHGSAQKLVEAMTSAGLEAEEQPLTITPALRRYLNQGIVDKLNPFGKKEPGGNVVGYLRGRDLSNEVVIVACHYDSVNWEDTTAAAPGVDDNGSGCALVLQTAKALLQASTKPRRSVLFVAFNAEEVGLVGSEQFADLFAHGGAGWDRYGKPVGAIVADEVAWPGVGGGSKKVIFETKGQGAATNFVVDTLAHQDIPSDGVEGFVVNYHGFGSDHISLLDAGVPAVLLIERDNMYHADTWGHSARDTFDHVDGAFGAAVTRMATRAVAAMANPSAATVFANATVAVANTNRTISAAPVAAKHVANASATGNTSI